MRIWSLVSQKGGSGKSTLATQLAVIASQQGEQPIIVDMDPQGSAEVWHGVRGKNLAPGAIAAIPENLVKVIDGARTMGITMLIIDTPPHSDKTALEAIRHSDLVICPTQSSIFDVWALRDTATIIDLCSAKDKAIVVINALPTSGTEAAYDEAAAAVREMGLKLAATGVGHRKAFVTSVNNGKGVTEMFPKDKAAEELRKLWNELSPPEKPAKIKGGRITKEKTQ